jgi:hypothetical protein
MSHHETPQNERGYKTRNPTLSPNSPYLYSPYLSPLWQQAPKRSLRLRWRGRVWRQGRDSPLRSNGEAGGVVIVGVLAEMWPSRRGGTRSQRRWSWWSCSRPSTWSQSLSGLGTWNLWVGGDRWRDLLGDKMKVVILLTQTLSPWCSEAGKR